MRSRRRAPRSATAPTSDAEPAFRAQDGAALEARRARVQAGRRTTAIGAATGIAFLHGGRQQAAAEPTRRGGGSAMVVKPG